MAEFDYLYKVSIGESGFQLTQFSASIEPIVKDRVGQTGARMTITGEGYVDYDNLGDATGKMQFPGQDIVVTGLGGQVEASLLAAECIDGGPHIRVELLKDNPAAMIKGVKFTAIGERGLDASGGGSSDLKSRSETATRSDKLRAITFTG